MTASLATQLTTILTLSLNDQQGLRAQIKAFEAGMRVPRGKDRRPIALEIRQGHVNDVRLIQNNLSQNNPEQDSLEIELVLQMQGISTAPVLICPP